MYNDLISVRSLNLKIIEIDLTVCSNQRGDLAMIYKGIEGCNSSIDNSDHPLSLVTKYI